MIWMPNLRRISGGLLLVALALSACGTEAPTATAVPAPPTLAATPTSMAATETPAPPPATSTALPNTATPALAPATATPAPPSPTAFSVELPSPSPAPPTAGAPPSPIPTLGLPSAVLVDTGTLTYPENGHIAGELVGGRAPAGACAADALRGWAGPKFEVAVDQAVTVNGQAGRVVLLGAQLTDDKGTPIATGVADYGQVRWLLVGPDCAQSGAYILPPRNDGNEWPPEADVARLHGTAEDQIVISSGAGAHWTKVNVFGYDERYRAWRNEGEFDGDGGAGVGAPQGYNVPGTDLAFQAQRDYDRSQLRALQIFAWDPSVRSYKLAETHIDFNFGPPDQVQFPEQAIILYYQAITAKDYAKAYSYLTPRMQQTLPFAQFQAGFVTTRRVWVSDLAPLGTDPATGPLADGSYTMQVQITSEDQAPDGTLAQKQFVGTWTARVQNNVAHLNAANIRQK